MTGKIVLADKDLTVINLLNGWKNVAGSPSSPSSITVKHPRQTDWHTYKERHLIEMRFLKLKNNRRFTNRYEKKEVYFLAVIFIACILVWLL